MPFAMLPRVDADLAFRMQFGFVVVMCCSAIIYREQTRVYGARPGERPPIVVGQPRKAGADHRRVLRVFAALAILVCVLYFVGAIVWVAS